MWYKYWSPCIFLNWCFYFLQICIPRSETAGSWGNFSFCFLKTLHTVLHTGCTILPSHQQRINVPFSPHTPQHVISDLFDDSRWSEILHCSLYLHFSSDLECWHLFMCLLIICISSLKQCLYRFLSFEKWDLFCLLLSCMRSF